MSMCHSNDMTWWAGTAMARCISPAKQRHGRAAPPLLALGQRNGGEKAAPCTGHASVPAKSQLRKGHTQRLTTYILPAQWQRWEHSLQLSITPCKHLHKDTVTLNVHLKASRGGAVRAAKQTPLENAHTIIISLIYSIQLWKAITRVKQVANARPPSKKGIFNKSGISTETIPMLSDREAHEPKQWPFLPSRTFSLWSRTILTLKAP